MKSYIDIQKFWGIKKLAIKEGPKIDSSILQVFSEHHGESIGPIRTQIRVVARKLHRREKNTPCRAIPLKKKNQIEEANLIILFVYISSV